MFKLPPIKKDKQVTFFSRNPRRYILPVAGILVCIFILFFVLLPVLRNINSMEAEVAQKEMQIKEIASLSRTYMDLKASNAEINKKVVHKGETFEILSFLEEIAKRVKISEKITSMKPIAGEANEMSASLVLKDLHIAELNDYLFQITNSGNGLTVRKMHLKTRDRDPRLLEASMEISALKSTPLLPSS